MAEMKLSKVKKDFPILSRRYNGKPIAYLDSAATTQKPRAVIDAISDYYENHNANVSRGLYSLEEESTEIFESARKKVAAFIGASADEIAFTRNTTESLNIVANMVCRSKKGGILLTEMEHHSNIVGWQLAAGKSRKIGFVGLEEDGALDIQDAKERISHSPSVFSFTHASNVLGNVNDAAKLCRMAKKNGSLTCVDAAQSAPHIPIDVKEIGCDFLAFSGHKMLGPMGIGVLYIRREIAEKMEPVIGGGGMISRVSLSGSDYLKPPAKFEAGTPDVAGAVGLSAAVDYIGKIGMENIGQHCSNVWKECLDGLSGIDGVEIYGDGRKTGIVSFNLDGVHAHDIAQIASDDAVMIRAGHHCAQPLMERLGVAAAARTSFYVYNDGIDAARLCESVKKAKRKFGV